jgi:hypothetical protein
MAVAIPPSTARFWKLRIIGGYTDTDIAGTAYFDGFLYREFVSPLVVKHASGIAEASTTGVLWADFNSTTVVLPALSSASIVRFSIVGQTTQPEMYQRFRIGSFYSNEGGPFDNGAYVSRAYTLLVRGLSGSQTLYQQLKTTSSGSGKVDAGDIIWEILNP